MRRVAVSTSLPICNISAVWRSGYWVPDCSVRSPQIIIGSLTFGLRGPYFAIGTLGVAIAAGELVSNWDWVGGGQGIALPVYPGDLDTGKIMFYFLFAAVGISVFVFVKWLYGTRFGAAINAIRDDEEKADAMGIHTCVINS